VAGAGSGTAGPLSSFANFTGGAYVPTLLVGMYAPLGLPGVTHGADMPKNGTSAPPATRAQKALKSCLFSQNPCHLGVSCGPHCEELCRSVLLFS